MFQNSSKIFFLKKKNNAYEGALPDIIVSSGECPHEIEKKKKIFFVSLLATFQLSNTQFERAPASDLYT